MKLRNALVPSLTVIPNAISATDRVAENKVLRCPRIFHRNWDHICSGGMELCSP